MARSKEEELFDGRIPFETPKPLKLINQLIKAGSSSHDTVLDFFSGSATTAHAVMQLKAEDGWHRKFIKDKAPTARLGFEVRGETGIRTVVRKVRGGDDLYALSNGLDEYQDHYVIPPDGINGQGNSVTLRESESL